MLISSRFVGTTRTNEDSIQDPLYSMSQWWKEDHWTEAWPQQWSWEGKKTKGQDEELFQRWTLKESSQRKVRQGRNPSLTPSTEDSRADARVLDWCDSESGEPLAPEVQTNEGRKAVREDRQRQEQQGAERSHAPLNPEPERGSKEMQSCKQRGGILPRDPGPRGGDAFP